MQILPVSDAAGGRRFIQVAVDLYRNDPHWIRPLDKDINEVFDPAKNKAFRSGTVQRWILQDDDGRPTGRIAAFTNKKYKNKGDDVPVGGIGFFECINNQEAADMLLDNARHWLLQQGMQAMDGPINFGERDRWWGMVTQGYQEPLYCMNYNPPYYKTLFEEYGFRPFYHQVCMGMHPKKLLQPKIWERHDRIAQIPGFRAEHIRKNKLEKYAADFTEVYNQAWAGHGGLKHLHKEQVVAMFRKMKPVMDERIIWFVYHQDSPVGIFINLPDLNQWFKELNGKFGLLHKLYFLWLKAIKRNKRFTGLVFGIVPEWQGKGVDAYLIGEAAKVIQSDQVPYTEYEMQWIGDFNPKMINIAENLGEVFRTRELTTYRYLFDRTKEFKRHPILV
ncbi:MAG: hypothetical protein U0T56_04835 [Ferruginibacter sp.]